MTISVGQTSKGRTSSASTIATAGVTTAASGSAIFAIVFWSGVAAFTSVNDNKGNGSYTQIDTEITVGGADHCRAYYMENVVGGAGHTISLNLGSAGAAPGIMMIEVPGGVLSGILDQHNRRDDTATPFTLATGLTTTQAAELLITGIVGNSGSNPGTMAESGLGSSTLQAGTAETNGASFFVSEMATKIVSSTGTFNPSWTQTGATGAAVWLVTFKEASGGTNTSKTMSETMTLADEGIDVSMRVRQMSDAAALVDQLVYGAKRGIISSDGVVFSDGTISGARRGVVATEALALLDNDFLWLRRTRVAEDALPLADGFVSWRRLARVSQDNLDLLDGFSRTVTGAGTVYGKVMSDTMDLSDGFVEWRRLKRLLTDNADLIDGFTKTITGAGIIYAKVMSDTTTLIDDVGQHWTLRTSRLSDALGLSDTVIRALARIRILGENIEYSDGVLRFLRAVRTPTDTIDLSDELVRAYFPDQVFTVAIVFGARESFRMSTYDPMVFRAPDTSLRFGGH